MHKRGMPQYSVEKFWSQNNGKPRRGTILCFRNFLVSNDFMDKRGGEYHDFPSEVFFSTMSKSFVAEPFRAVLQKFSGSDKIF